MQRARHRHRHAPGCRNATVGNPAIFTPANLAQYDAIFFWQASSLNRGDTTSPQLFNTAEQTAIEEFARAGGGIGAMHASVTMGAGARRGRGGTPRATARSAR